MIEEVIMTQIYLLRSRWSGEVLGTFSTIDLANKAKQQCQSPTYIQVLPLDSPNIEY